MDGFLGGFLKFIYYILVCGIVLALAFYTSKLVAKRATPGGRSRNMKLLETLPIGLDKSLILVKVGERNFLFTNMQKSINCVAEISSEDLKGGSLEGFEEILEKENETYIEDSGVSVQTNLARLKKLFRGNVKDE
mgnify:CR=1 FL=1